MIIQADHWQLIFLMVPLFIASLIGIGVSLFSGLFGGEKKHPIEALELQPPPSVPINPSDVMIGLSLVGLGVYLFIKR